MQIIKEYWFLISSIVIPAGAFLIGVYKLIKLIKKGLCALQRNSLLKSCEDYLKKGCCTMEAKITLNELYKSYHSLGGDTFITQMVERVNELPTKPLNN